MGWDFVNLFGITDGADNEDLQTRDNDPMDIQILMFLVLSLHNLIIILVSVVFLIVRLWRYEPVIKLKMVG